MTNKILPAQGKHRLSKPISLVIAGFLATWIILSTGAALGLVGGIIALAASITVMSIGIFKVMNAKLLSRKEKRRERRDRKVTK